MPHPLALLGAHSLAPSQGQIVSAEVAAPAPSGYDDPLHVILPDFSRDIYFTCVTWPAMHGRTLPQAGAQALVIFDDHGNPWCVAWTGSWIDWDPPDV